MHFGSLKFKQRPREEQAEGLFFFLFKYLFILYNLSLLHNYSFDVAFFVS